MDAESIERALRLGPIDEPIYVPGSFRRSRRRFWSLAVASGVMAISLVVGIAAGFGLSALRTGDGVGRPDVAALGANLEGIWVSQEITRQDWIDGLAAMGHDMGDIEAFLVHDPIEARTRYELRFLDDHLQVFESVDGTAYEGQGGGPYRLLSSGAVYYDDIGCFITARFAIVGDRLSFEPIVTESCDAEEGVANSAFFNLVDYTRADTE